MIANERQQPVPIQAAACGIHQVGNVGSVEALTKCDKQFGSYQLFRCENLRLNPEHLGFEAAVDPGLIHANHSVAHS